VVSRERQLHAYGCADRLGIRECHAISDRDAIRATHRVAINFAVVFRLGVGVAYGHRVAYCHCVAFGYGVAFGFRVGVGGHRRGHREHQLQPACSSEGRLRRFRHNHRGEIQHRQH
jgi:hypothetical protein